MNHPEKQSEPRPSVDERIGSGAERLKRSESAAVKATRDTLDNAAERTERAMHGATDASASAARKASAKASELNARGREASDRALSEAEDLFGTVQQYVSENPGKSLAFAIAGGWLLGRLTRRS